MRTILFRGQRIGTKEWVYGDLLHIAGGCIIYHGSKIKCTTKQNEGSAIELFANEISAVIPETVGQYTGLKDINEVMVFEGDVVKYYQPYADKWEIHNVLWDEKWAGFGLFEQDNEWCKESDWVKIKKIEIIGNIHEKHVL